MDEKQVRAVAELVTALDNTATASLLVGSILFVKRTDQLTGKSVINIVVRSLTQRQMVELERNASLFVDPDALFKTLDRVEEPRSITLTGDGPNANLAWLLWRMGIQARGR